MMNIQMLHSLSRTRFGSNVAEKSPDLPLEKENYGNYFDGHKSLFDIIYTLHLYTLRPLPNKPLEIEKLNQELIETKGSRQRHYTYLKKYIPMLDQIVQELREDYKLQPEKIIGWRASMSQADGDKWVKSSQQKQDIYTTGTEKDIQSIFAEGYDHRYARDGFIGYLTPFKEVIKDFLEHRWKNKFNLIESWTNVVKKPLILKLKVNQRHPEILYEDLIKRYSKKLEPLLDDLPLTLYLGDQDKDQGLKLRIVLYQLLKNAGADVVYRDYYSVADRKKYNLSAMPTKVTEANAPTPLKKKGELLLIRPTAAASIEIIAPENYLKELD